MARSFYDFDYLIELNENRLKEFSEYYQKMLDRTTTVILIYSILVLFLIPLIEHYVMLDIKSQWYYICCSLYIFCFAISVRHFIGLLVPATIAFVERPQKYYREYLPQMEALHANNRLKVNESLKGAYIIELETAVNTNFSVFQRKKSMFYNAMVFALLVPFLILFVLGTICPPNATKCKGLLF